MPHIKVCRSSWRSSPSMPSRSLRGRRPSNCAPSLWKSDSAPIVIYASREVGRVVGVAEYAGLLRAPPDALWGRVRARAGIERRDYDAYFGDKPEAYAIQLRNPRRVSPVKPGWRVQPGWMFLRAENPQHLKVLEAASLI